MWVFFNSFVPEREYVIFQQKFKFNSLSLDTANVLVVNDMLENFLKVSGLGGPS